MNKCLCGCGIDVKNKYVLGHVRRGIPVSEETKKRMKKSHKLFKRIYGIRSVIDYGIKSKIETRFYNTKPERFLKSILSVNGIKYESQKKIYGRPDIFIKPNTCIFVDGCYWHGCKKCGFKSNKKTEHDIIVNEKLKLNGYKIIRIWEHDIVNGINPKVLEEVELNAY